ncbi:MAG TPA: TetR/AcrR family transcriptional regulator [Oculatellaceae cyanobacterium]
MGRREIKKEATKQEILTAAAELFRTKGYESTSVDDIVAAANVAKGTFYYHFEAKEDLVLALQEAELRVASERAKKRMEGSEPSMTILLDFLNDSAHWTTANSELAKAMFKQKFEMMMRKPNHEHCPSPSGPPASIKEYFFGTIHALISRAQATNEFRNDLPAQEIVHIIIPVVMSARMHWLMDSQQESLMARVEKSLMILMEGFKPR